MNKQEQPGAGDRRLTIGLIINSLFEDYELQLWRNIVSITRESGCNILCFSAGSIENPEFYRKSRNVLYDFISRESVDGLISLSGVLGRHISNAQLGSFFSERFRDLPLVNIGAPNASGPGVVVDNKRGMEEMMTHLIVEHNCQRIAYICGPEGNSEADVRFAIYKKKLLEYNRAFDPALVVQGDFNALSGKEAVKILLDQRKKSFDFLLCANDVTAISAMIMLQERGINVPGDVGVAGFDDIKEAKSVTPSLTTIKQPFYEISRKAVELLCSMIRGEEVAFDEFYLPARLVTRRSCGCRIYHENYDPSLVIPGKRERPQSSGVRKSIREIIIDEIGVVLTEEFPGIMEDRMGWGKKIVGALLDELMEEQKGKFISTLESAIARYMDKGIEAVTWVKVASSVCFRVLTLFPFVADVRQLKDLLSQALISIGFTGERYQVSARIRQEEQIAVLLLINEGLLSAFNEEQLKAIVLKELPALGMKSCYFLLYEPESGEFSDKARVLINYDHERGEVGSIEGESCFTQSLIPGGIKNLEHRFEYMVLPLFFKEEQLGYVLLEINLSSGMIYENLATQFSGALKGARLLDKVKRYSNELEEKVQERTSELEQKNREIEQANQKLKELDAMKNNFIANITHDFRSPLTVVMNISDLALKYNKDLDEENRENYEIIYQSALKLLRTINRLLDLAKLDAGEISMVFKPTDLISLLHSLINFYSTALSNTHIRILNALPEISITDFYTDGEKLEKVVNNIISHSLASIDPLEGRITIGLVEEEDFAVIRISDNGHGATSEELQNIFKRFHNSSNSRDWAGVGLAFANELVEHLKGVLLADSEGPGKGMVFQIRLPKGRSFLSPGDLVVEGVVQKDISMKSNLLLPDLDSPESATDLEIRFTTLNKENEFDYKKAKILIIDDDPYVRNIISQYLIEGGYHNFILAADGQYGLEAVYSYIPDIIICDYHMKKLNGDAFHDELITNPAFSDLPFIFLSAIADMEIIFDRKEKGASAYLKKPINEKELLLTVDQNLKKYMKHCRTMLTISTDGLTGLNNRTALFARLNNQLGVRSYRNLSVLFFDVDLFKSVNDVHGHQAGDIVLKEIGTLIRESVRSSDIPARYGGDEFCIILPDTNLAQAREVAENLRRKVETHSFSFKEEVLKVTLSIGVASMVDDEAYIRRSLHLECLKSFFQPETAELLGWEKIEQIQVQLGELLMEMADTALYKAKKTVCRECGCNSVNSRKFISGRCPQCGSRNLNPGRNRVAVFTQP